MKNRYFQPLVIPIAILGLAACSVGANQTLIGEPVEVGTDTQGNKIYQRCVGTTYGEKVGPQMVQINCYQTDATGKLLSNTPVSQTSASTPSMADAAVGGIAPAAVLGTLNVGAAVALGKTMPKTNGGTASATACQSQATSGTAGNNNC